MRESCDSLAAGIPKIYETNNTKIVCTGSLTSDPLADMFMRVPGTSNVLLGSAITYDISAKASILHVDKALLDRGGVAHPEVARQMAVGTAHLYGQPEYGDRIIGPPTTGVADPGLDGDKPIGLVYVGLRIPVSLIPDHAEVLKAIELHLDDMHEEIRRLTVFHILQNLSLSTTSLRE